ncbi:MAG: hypothetical protein CYPHOPRED_002225 [Cyphobasidiales sp. Tagirdzhanova-0007]|nr:MAG: hypothetical protein CYPHOPRED_002225 [Cyphobasidiales sp. Tagirdzhanova-0007]
MKEKLGEVKELDGFEDLGPEDQEKVTKAWETGEVDPADIPESAKTPPGEEDGEEGENSSPKKKAPAKKAAPKKKKKDDEDGSMGEEEDEEKPKKKRAAPKAKTINSGNEDAGSSEPRVKRARTSAKKSMKEGSTDPDDETGDPAGDYVDEDEDEKPKPKSRASKGTVTPKKKPPKSKETIESADEAENDE